MEIQGYAPKPLTYPPSDENDHFTMMQQPTITGISSGCQNWLLLCRRVISDQKKIGFWFLVEVSVLGYLELLKEVFRNARMFVYY